MSALLLCNLIGFVIISPPCYIDVSCTTVVVHNRDQAEIFQNTLIERTPKAAFRALDFISKTF